MADGDAAREDKLVSVQSDRAAREAEKVDLVGGYVEPKVELLNPSRSRSKDAND